MFRQQSKRRTQRRRRTDRVFRPRVKPVENESQRYEYEMTSTPQNRWSDKPVSSAMADVLTARIAASEALTASM